ncbi:hypothetical protein RHECNPAF_2190050 [Rhizobium etli CNPAF512]|nr:hypothetical protein RHECNPAF_2190050 [Rhizobium etli CNPAF512]
MVTLQLEYIGRSRCCSIVFVISEKIGRLDILRDVSFFEIVVFHKRSRE